MRIFYKLIIIFFLLFLTYPLHAHVDHYNGLNRIEFAIYRNNKHIGEHIFSFENFGEDLLVKSNINFVIKKFGIVLYKYNAEGIEEFKNGKLIKFISETNQNGKKKYVNMKLDNEVYVIDGSSYKGEAPADFFLGTWWNHGIVNSEAQISAVSGRLIKQKVSFLGKEKIKIGNKSFDALHFNFSSTDKKFDKNKKLNTDVWYDEKTLNWIKASFKKKGNWEYRLISVN